jgi:hypothetical protein
MSRIINSPDYGAVSPIELKVFRDLDKLLKKQEHKKKKGKRKNNGKR